MKITVFGAVGAVGSRVVTEAHQRGHETTAVVRDRARFHELPEGVKARAADVTSTAESVELLRGQDLVISALRPSEGQEDSLVPLTRAVLDAAAEAQVRALVVSGAASLRMPDEGGVTVLTSPGFLPDAVLPIAQACFAQYELFQAERQADATLLCAPAMLMPGQRTGRYRLGSDTLVVNEAGESRISMEDFAVALLDEAETSRHRGQRFTVGY